MKDMIKALYYGRVDPSELYLKHRSKYKKALEKQISVLDSLECERNHEPLEKLRSLIMETEGEMSYAHFAVGFRWGARMMLSILTEGDTALETEEDNEHD